MATRQFMMASALLAAAMAVQVQAAVLTENFQDGNISENPIWAVVSAGNGNGNVVTKASETDLSNKALTFTGNTATRLTTGISDIAAGTVVTLNFKTLKSTTGANGVSFGLLNADGTGILFTNDLSDTYGNRLLVWSTTDTGATTTARSTFTGTVAAGTNVWHDFQITWNTSTGVISVAIDGGPTSSVTVSQAAMTTPLTQAIIRNAYAATIFIDDITVNIPEPAALGMFGIGGTALLARRR